LPGKTASFYVINYVTGRMLLALAPNQRHSCSVSPSSIAFVGSDLILAIYAEGNGIQCSCWKIRPVFDKVELRQTCPLYEIIKNASTLTIVGHFAASPTTTVFTTHFRSGLFDYINAYSLDTSPEGPFAPVTIHKSFRLAPPFKVVTQYDDSRYLLSAAEQCENDTQLEILFHSNDLLQKESQKPAFWKSATPTKVQCLYGRRVSVGTPETRYVGTKIDYAVVPPAYRIPSGGVAAIAASFDCEVPKKSVTLPTAHAYGYYCGLLCQEDTGPGDGDEEVDDLEFPRWSTNFYFYIQKLTVESNTRKL
jgi:hypothetical protein